MLKGFQQSVAKWFVDSHVENALFDMPKRTTKFLIHSLRLVRSLSLTATDAHAIVDYVYAQEDLRSPHQEIDETLLTLTVLCEAAEVDLDTSAYTVLIKLTPAKVIKLSRRKAWSYN
jgi:hypothetical protein